MCKDDTDRPQSPAEKILQAAQEKLERQEKEVVACPECGTEVLKDSIDEAVEAADKHDEQRHEGEPTTKVNGIVPPQFSEDEKQEIQETVQTLREQDQSATGEHNA